MVTDLPVIREILEDGVTAALCPADAPEAWASRLDALIADPAQRQRLGVAARDRLRKQYTWAMRAARIMDNL
jgi:glycosyltransferase involved in cell wall biosynthesis